MYVRYFVILCIFYAFQAHAVMTHSTRGNGASNEGVWEDSSATSCMMPKSTTKFAVDTDGGDANGSETHSNHQSYEKDWGGTLDPAQVMGAVNVTKNGLEGGDIICYENTSNPSAPKVCGVVFDNGYDENESGADKPQEATAPVHKALGARSANGSGSTLSGSNIKAHPIKVSPDQKEKLKEALRIARETGSYTKANELIQEIGLASPCLQHY